MPCRPVSAWSKVVRFRIGPKLEQRRANFANQLTLDPEVKCYLPGVPRATYMPFPFQIIQSTEHIMLLHGICGRGPDDLYDRSRRRAGR